MPPTNDNFVHAVTFTLGTPISLDLTGSTVEATEYDGFNALGTPGSALRAVIPFTVWAKYTASSSITLQVSAATLPDGYARGELYYLIYIWNPGHPSATVGNVTPLTLNYADLTTAFSVTSGQVAYIQVAATTDPNGAGQPNAFDLLLSEYAGGPIDLAADISPFQTIMEASLTVPLHIAATISGSSTGHATIAINSSYADIHGATSATAILAVNSNPHVEPYDDPYTTTGGPFPVVNRNYRAGVQLHEAIGATPTLHLVDQHLTLLANSNPTNEGDPKDYTTAPVNITGSSALYTTERWVRVQFLAPFNSVENLRVWLNPATSPRPGWTIRFGITDTYATPINTASIVATSSLPTADPGPGVQDLIGSAYFDGSLGDAASRWIVLQGVVNPATADPGPIQGFTRESMSPVPLQLEMAWSES